MSRRSQRREIRRGRRLRQGLAGGAAVVVLGAGVAFATVPSGSDDADGRLTSAGVGMDREPWLQASRSGVDRVPLEGADPVTFTVIIDGESREVTSAAPTLATALADEGIAVGFDDVVSVPMSEAPTEGMTVEITRVETRTEVFTETIEHASERHETATLPEGAEQLETEGRDGERETTASVTYSGGTEVSREVLAEVVSTEPVTEVVLVGTGPAETAASAESPDSSVPADSGGPVNQSYSGEDPRGIAQAMLADRGWGEDQWQCLNKLWERESGWNPSAHNSSSGAYGIPQALPGSKMASVGADWRTNPATQIEWGLGYVKGRYGTPCGAWGHFQAKNWY
ncbi:MULTISPECIES: G5 domain-containing protein [unclassified Pseudactinotalea]|uniref:aggregation-promoting factor C-terminal-like domain-containing protein n=1 Tax=unclassified Pseudactinotalea TaxID=2649176 RepID=UPI00128CBAAA|nr:MULTISPECIES: G5 domain-containing protein [unclassified Pseudactinotalea]MPV48679.1 DUF348 domain-containing protein [Pseudactinotalea sp. HY160]QGH68649.1 DUF348 domain-containing protein [Pseudactinotalea sp. HY158]